MSADEGLPPGVTDVDIEDAWGDQIIYDQADNEPWPNLNDRSGKNGIWSAAARSIKLLRRLMRIWPRRLRSTRISKCTRSCMG